MSGHSKWSNIKHRKDKTDAQKAKIFTKIGREIVVCVKSGGDDPSSNNKLKDLIAKAKSNNVPSDNIERIIKKAAGDGDKNDYESVIYEGYGPSGVAVIVEALTDNRNRTAGDVRHYFDKFGGNLGTSGCVSFMFDEKGVIIIQKDKTDDEIMEDCLEAGADDFIIEEEVCQVFCEPENIRDVKEALEQAKYAILSAEIEKVPQTYTAIENEEHIVKMSRLIEMLEENDDVQNIYHNWENEPEE